MKLLFLDGGGTKIQAVYYDKNNEIEYATFGSCNLTLDFNAAKINIFSAIESFINHVELDAIIIAAAGALSCPELAKEIAGDVLKQYNVSVKIISDIEYHYYKYFLKNDGYVVNLGTGTSALAFKNKHRHLYFGFGPNFEEPGCGHDIGKKLLAFLAYQEANNPHNLLYVKYLSDHNCDNIRQNVKTLNRLSNSEIAAHAKWLLSLTNIDGLMSDIKQVICESMCKLILWLADKQDQHIYFIGGIVKNQYIQTLIRAIVKLSHFNEKCNYTMEEIWNML